MNVMVVVGSPRREHGLTHIIATELARAAGDAGALVSIEYLVDYDPGYCTHCCNTCFADGFCRMDQAINGLRTHAKIT